MRGRRLAAFLTVVLAGLCTAPIAHAQNRVSASVDRTSVSVGETLVFQVEVEGRLDAGVDLTPPQALGLRLTQPMPTLRMRSMVNGRETLRVEWTYRAEQVGNGRIGSMRIPLRGGAVTTAPIEVTVTGAPTQAPSSPTTPLNVPTQADGDLFVRAEPSRSSAVTGQQVVLNYVLYFTPRLQPSQTELAGTWDAPGFWKEELEVPPPDTYPRPVTIGGERYRAVTIRRLALFPTRTGSLDLDPMRFRISLLRTASGPFGGLFGGPAPRYDREMVEAPAFTLPVRALPDGAPPSFSGAVGDFDLSATLSADSVARGTPVKLRVTLRGTGNLATLEAPRIEVPPSFDAFGPESEQTVDTQGPRLTGARSFTTTLLPTSGGTFSIGPVTWSFFDPTAGRYRTLRSSAFPVTVSGPAAAAPSAPVASGETPSVLVTRTRWRESMNVPPGVLWAVLIGGLLSPLVVMGGRRLVQRIRAGAPSPEARARQVLATATQRLDDAPPSERADAASRAVRSVLHGPVGVPRSLSNADIEAHLIHRNGNTELATRIRRFLDEVDRTRFAATEAPSDLTQRARELLHALHDARS